MAYLDQPTIARSGFISLAIKVLGAGLSYAMAVVFARLLKPDEYGLFAYGMNGAIILAALGNFGFATGIMRYWPQLLVAGQTAKARAVVGLGYRSIFIGGLVVASLALTIAQALPSFTSSLPSYFIMVVAGLALAINIGDYATNLLRAQGSTVVSMLPRDVLWRIFTPVVCFAALNMGFGLTGTSSLLISACVLLALNLWQYLNVRRRIELLGETKSVHIEISEFRASLLPLWLSSVIFAMIQQFDVVIVGSLLSKGEAGSYFAAQKTAQLLSLVLIAGGLATAPIMAALFHAGKLRELQNLCRKLAIAIAAATIIGYGILIFGGHLLLGLFDPSFVAAYPILLVIGLGAVVDAMSGPNALLMQMTSYEVPYFKIMLVCYAIVLAAQFVLVPRFGSIGAALASAGGVILWNILSIAILRRRAGLDPSLLSFLMPPQRTSPV